MMNTTPRTFVGTTTFRVDGMSCDHCARAVVREVGLVPGVGDVTVDLAGGLATVSTTSPVDRADISAAIDEAGYTLVP